LFRSRLSLIMHCFHNRKLGHTDLLLRLYRNQITTKVNFLLVV
jgi:hypothetical protein